MSECIIHFPSATFFYATMNVCICACNWWIRSDYLCDSSWFFLFVVRNNPPPASYSHPHFWWFHVFGSKMKIHKSTIDWGMPLTRVTAWAFTVKATWTSEPLLQQLQQLGGRGLPERIQHQLHTKIISKTYVLPLACFHSELCASGYKQP